MSRHVYITYKIQFVSRRVYIYHYICQPNLIYLIKHNQILHSNAISRTLVLAFLCPLKCHVVFKITIKFEMIIIEF
jgi:hypothetical protein